MFDIKEMTPEYYKGCNVIRKLKGRISPPGWMRRCMNVWVKWNNDLIKRAKQL